MSILIYPDERFASPFRMRPDAKTNNCEAL
jgi:hypothetical protein